MTKSCKKKTGRPCKIIITPPPLQKRGRRKKYATDEERLEAGRAARRRYRDRNIVAARARDLAAYYRKKALKLA